MWSFGPEPKTVFSCDNTSVRIKAAIATPMNISKSKDPLVRILFITPAIRFSKVHI